MFVFVNNFQFCRDLSVYFAIFVIKLRKMLYFLIGGGDEFRKASFLEINLQRKRQR